MCLMLKVTFRCRHTEWIKSMHICQSGYMEPPCRHFCYEEHSPCSLSSHRPCQDGISVQSDHRLLCDHCSLLALAKVGNNGSAVNKKDVSSPIHLPTPETFMGPISFLDRYRNIQERLVAEARVTAEQDRARYAGQVLEPTAQEMAAFRVMIRT